MGANDLHVNAQPAHAAGEWRLRAANATNVDYGEYLMLTNPKLVIAAYAILIAVLWSLGGFVLSRGWSRIDSSAHRNLLYRVMFIVIPVVVLAAAIHISLALLPKATWLPSLIIALVLGLAGPLLLHLIIVKSEDGEAGMAYLAMVWSYCIVFAVAFLISYGIIAASQ